MTDPDMIQNWCRRLIEAYMVNPSPEKQNTHTITKGPGEPKLASGTATQPQPQPKARADEYVRQRDDCVVEATAAGYASGTETEHAAEPKEDVQTPIQKLLSLIDDVPASVGGTEGVGEPLVPNALPLEMKTKIYQITREEFSEMYRVDTALARVEGGTISRCELVAMYMKSFRNILNYDLFELHEHQTFFGRFVNYCTHVLQDLVEALYPDEFERHENLVSE